VALLALALFVAGSGCRSGATTTGPSPVSHIVRNGTREVFIEDNNAATGLPLVFIHGAAGSTLVWRNETAAIAETRRTLAIDVRGHARSPRPSDGDYSWAALLGDVELALDSSRVRRAILVGHSAGAAIALRYALAESTRVAGIVLIDPPIGSAGSAELQRFIGTLDQPDFRTAVRAAWEQALITADDATRKVVLEELREAPRDAVVGLMRDLLSFDITADLARFRGPVLILRSGQPRARLVGGGGEISFAGSSHWIQLQRSREVTQIVCDFAQNIERDSLPRRP
jgi:pimeloyl-ACP methyl ester carboxylesterase